ncbi:YkgJ family cysteine cluster protein [Chitinispirillales bacterium ANBcel5]|uniref:YkgJ family cysteine cluster protein n=1 Tax=Cellulosispirillum alkaliphilum TaxID=3039283 RepID=UPI002A5656C5|nr:YkgJ family cysteine cluster protein [Chitinispirillales bacterium ANBcel5]
MKKSLKNENPCSQCDAHCCKHVAVQIDTPEDKSDYDTIRWYLLHRDVWVSIDHSEDWLIEFRTPCQHILPDYKCGIYENRPTICREYPAEDEICEAVSDELSYTHLFKTVEDFESYLNKIKKKKAK